MPELGVAPLAAIGFLILLALTAAITRIPVWNPLYYLVLLFSVQILAGWGMAGQLGIDFPVGFEIAFLAAPMLACSIMLLLSLRARRAVVAHARISSVLDRASLGPRAWWGLVACLAGFTAIITLSNAIVTARYGTLPFLAMARFAAQARASMGAASVLPSDMYAQFSVPFLTLLADNVVNAGVVAWFLLTFLPKRFRTRPDALEGLWLKRVASGVRSVPLWVHGLFMLLMFDAAVFPRRNLFAVALLTLALLLLITGRVKVRHVGLTGIVIVVLVAALGSLRRGTTEFHAASALPVADQARMTIVYEPAIYLGSGVLNFGHYWAQPHGYSYGTMVLSTMLPRPVAEPLGLVKTRQYVLHDIFERGYPVPGQTLRSGWFEAYYEFGVPGVVLLALVFPVVLFYLYRKTFAAPPEKPSYLYFAMAKTILLFPLINILFQAPFWIALASGLAVDAFGRSAWRRPAS